MTRDHAVFAHVDPMFETKLIRYSSFRALAQTHVATSCDSGGIETTLKRGRKVANDTRFIVPRYVTYRETRDNWSFYLHCPPYSIIGHVVRQFLHSGRDRK